MFDCHAHLADPAFHEDLDEVLRRAEQSGVERILCVSEGSSDSARVIDLARSHPMIIACLGLHPDRATLPEAMEVGDLIERNHRELAAIGEVGLDYWVAKEEEQRGVQREVLAFFAALAGRLDLPLNVHSRSAGHHAIAFLQQLGARRVLMHAFDGKASAALVGVEAGYYFSIPPSVVRSPQKQKLVRRLPLSSLLLESDSPVLGPTPQERNEPKNTLLSAQAIADAKGCSLDEVVEVTSANARALFRLEG
ncbi:MAG: TatD family hydrolase [Bradymonadales bacterium]|nr:TatD family hydrolase [Bradymonadales bacterium]